MGEWQRRFEIDEPPPPGGIQVGSVGSPIPAKATHKMKNRHWLGAIARYKDDRDYRPELFKGGAYQLANELEQRTIEDPIRFARLADEIPDDANQAYFTAILRGVGSSKSDIPIGVAATLMERCHPAPGRPHERVRSLADASICLSHIAIGCWSRVFVNSTKHSWSPQSMTKMQSNDAQDNLLKLTGITMPTVLTG